VAALAPDAGCRRILIASTADVCTRAVIFFILLQFAFGTSSNGKPFCYFYLFLTSLAVSVVGLHPAAPGSIPGSEPLGRFGSRMRSFSTLDNLSAKSLHSVSRLLPFDLFFIAIKAF
jgi:hypothetical protein